jgi:hypothetical protein
MADERHTSVAATSRHDGKSEEEVLGPEALARAVAERETRRLTREERAELKLNRRRPIRALSMRAECRPVDGGEVLTLHRCLFAFHRPMNDSGPGSTATYVAGPSLLPLPIAAGTAALAAWFALSTLSALSPIRIGLTVGAAIFAMSIERWFAHRRLDVQIAGGHFALYRNGNKKPFALGKKSEFKGWVRGYENYREARLMFPKRSLLSGMTEHDIFFQPVASDTADVIEGFLKRSASEE